MKQKQNFNKIWQSIFVVGLLCLVGCSSEVSSDTIVTPTMAEAYSSGNMETPVPTAGTLQEMVTPSPTIPATATPTPTPTVTPTPTPFTVYDQILQFETETEADSEIPVKAALLVDITNDKVIYSDHATEVIYPASITKLMTALLAFSLEQDLTQTVEVSSTAVIPVIPSAKMCGFKAGDRIRFNDLLGCMLIYSGNDTSVAVAEHISGSESEFVSLMNQKAEEFGLKSTHFCNSHGLPDDNHVTSAYDIYLIMQKLFNFEDFFDIIGLGSIQVDVLRGDSLKTLSFTSTNQFLWNTYQLPEGITLLGGKTGTTNKAGCCLSLYVQDASGNCYIAEIFGAESYESLYPSMIQLLNHISE